MAATTGYVSISRRHSVSNILRRFSVVIDDTVVDKIRSGETKKYALPAGAHTVQVRIDYFKSETLQVRLADGNAVDLECGDAGPQSLGDSLSLAAVKTSLKSLVSPSGFLFLRQTDSAPAAAASPPAPRPAGTSPGRRRASRRRSGPTVFLSYRREDSRAITGRISDRLNDHFGDTAIFRDVDSIPIGVDFRERIRDSIDQSDVLIAIIGPGWLSIRNADGQRRLDMEEDFVRLEIETALARDIPVVPVLVDGAELPQADDLPESLAPLAYRNALFIPAEPYFHAGVDKLVSEIDTIGKGKQPGRPSNRFCVGCGSTLGSQKFCTNCGQSTGATA